MTADTPVRLEGLNRLADPREFVGGVYAYRDTRVPPEVLAGQPPTRAWEYSQAVRALRVWLRRWLVQLDSALVVEHEHPGFAYVLEGYLAAQRIHHATPEDWASQVRTREALFAVNVVCALGTALSADVALTLTEHVAPGGLLVLTFPTTPSLTAEVLKAYVSTAAALGLRTLDRATFEGPVTEAHRVGSLAFVREDA
jgi:hypothetical protein